MITVVHPLHIKKGIVSEMNKKKGDENFVTKEQETVFDMLLLSV